MGILGFIVKTAVKTAATGALAKVVADVVSDSVSKTADNIGQTTTKAKSDIVKEQAKQSINIAKEQTKQNIMIDQASMATASNPLLKMPDAAKDFIGMDAYEIRDELDAFGFTNIVLLEQKDLKKGFFAKGTNNTIAMIAVNGDKNFKAGDMYLANSRIVIKYHTFA